MQTCCVTGCHLLTVYVRARSRAHVCFSSLTSCCCSARCAAIPPCCSFIPPPALVAECWLRPRAEVDLALVHTCTACPWVLYLVERAIWPVLAVLALQTLCCAFLLLNVYGMGCIDSLPRSPFAVPDSLPLLPVGPRIVLWAGSERGRVLQCARLPAALPHQRC